MHATVSTAGAEGGAASVVAGTPAQEIATIGTPKEEARSVKKGGRNTKRAKHQAGLGVHYGVPPLRAQRFRKLGLVTLLFSNATTMIVVGLWLDCGWIVVGLWLECGWFVVGLWLGCGWTVVGLWLECGWTVVGLFSLF